MFSHAQKSNISLLQAQERSKQLSCALRQVQTEHAVAEVATAEANDALDELSERASRKKREWPGYAVRHRFILACQNRLRAKERKAKIRASSVARKLKTARDEETRLIWRDTVGIEAPRAQADDEQARLLARFRQY